MAGKDRRGPHQRFIRKLRDEHERRTGHTPTDREQRQIERKSEDVARNIERLEERKNK